MPIIGRVESYSMTSQSFPSEFIDNALLADTDFIPSVVLRTLIMSVFVIFAIRWMGHKGLGQLSIYELIILIGLGSAIGDPMIYKDITLLHAFTAILVVIIIFKILDYLTARSKKFAKNFNHSCAFMVFVIFPKWSFPF